MRQPRHIDLSAVLKETISCELYSNLVTRPTGAAVRGAIERLLSEADVAQALTVIDMSQVSMIDFSCADEVIAKLVMKYSGDEAPGEVYFVFRGIGDDHWIAIEAVLERHGLAVVLETGDGYALAGPVSENEIRAWDAVRLLGPAPAVAVAQEIACDPDEMERTLEDLWRRRVLVKLGSDYAALGHFEG
jgi:hypothetical protein